MGPGYSPFVNSNVGLSPFPRSLDFTTALLSHPMLNGVTDFTYGGNLNYTPVSLDPGALLVGSDSFAVPLLGISASGRVAGVNVYPGPVLSKSPGVFLALANSCTAVSLIEVLVDIKPGSDPNCFNNNGHGAMPVAILGEPDFDVRDIDPGSVELDGVGVKSVGKSDKLLAHFDDVNGDGYEDLVVQIQDLDGVFEPGDTIAKVTGSLFDGRRIQGVDSICIVP